MQADSPDRPYDPNDPSTWQDPSGNPVNPDAPFDLPGYTRNPSGAPPSDGPGYDGSGYGSGINPSQARASLLDGVSADPGPANGGVQHPVMTAATAPPPDAPPAPAYTPGNTFTNTSPLANQFPAGSGPTITQPNPDFPGLTQQQLREGEAAGGIAEGSPNWKILHPDVAPPPPPPPPTPGPGPLPAPSIGPSGDTAAYNAKLRAFLLSQLGDLSTPTDENSPEIAPSLSAYRNQSTRDEEAFRNAAAERFYAQGEGGGEGLSSGGFGTALTGGMEAAAANRSNFAGNLVWNASQMKRQQLQAMLQTAVNAGETDAAQEIQSQIAGIDANLRGRGLDQQNSQFNDSLAKQYADLQAQMNRDQMLSALRG